VPDSGSDRFREQDHETTSVYAGPTGPSAGAARWTPAALGMDRRRRGVRAALERGAAAAVSCWAGRRLPGQPQGAHPAAGCAGRRGQAAVKAGAEEARRRTGHGDEPRRRGRGARGTADADDTVRKISVDDALGIVRGGHDLGDRLLRAQDARTAGREVPAHRHPRHREGEAGRALQRLRRPRPPAWAWSRATTPTCSSTSPPRRWTGCT
jgi:hypothetical protein